MLILKILLIVLLALLGIVLLAMLLPVTVAISYKKSFKVRVYYCGIKVFTTDPKKQKKDTNTEDTADIPEKKKPNFFKEIYDKKGLRGTVDYFTGLMSIILKRLRLVLKHIKFRKLRFGLWVASGDAADTAIQYGAVCSAVYPAFSALMSVADCKPKKINIFADFNSEKSKLEFSFIIRSLPIFIIVAAIGGLWEYKKYKVVNSHE